MQSEVNVGVNVVAICPNREVRNTLIRAIQETSGIRPVLKSDSESASRAHYAPAPAKLIINTASERMHRLLGKHSIALAIEVADRIEAAKVAQRVFKDAGLGATVHTQAEPEFPDGFLTFVSVPALEGIVLMFWPRKEDVSPELMAQLPQREPWTDAELV